MTVIKCDTIDSLSFQIKEARKVNDIEKLTVKYNSENMEWQFIFTDREILASLYLMVGVMKEGKLLNLIDGSFS